MTKFRVEDMSVSEILVKRELEELEKNSAELKKLKILYLKSRKH